MWTETLQLHKPQSTAPEHPHLSDYKIAQTCLSSWHLLTLAYFMVPGSWPGRKSSMLYPVKLQEKLNSPRSEENKPGQSQWVLTWIVMYLWHNRAGLLLLPLQVLQKHISPLSSLTTFQEFLAGRSMFLAPLCRLHTVTLKSSTEQSISRWVFLLGFLL